MLQGWAISSPFFTEHFSPVIKILESEAGFCRVKLEKGRISGRQLTPQQSRGSNFGFFRDQLKLRERKSFLVFQILVSFRFFCQFHFFGVSVFPASQKSCFGPFFGEKGVNDGSKHKIKENKRSFSPLQQKCVIPTYSLYQLFPTNFLQLSVSARPPI